jgi:hypothetical protein
MAANQHSARTRGGWISFGFVRGLPSLPQHLPQILLWTDCRERLLKLQELGYRFPDRVFTLIDNEVQERVLGGVPDSQ